MKAATGFLAVGVPPFVDGWDPPEGWIPVTFRGVNLAGETVEEIVYLPPEKTPDDEVTE